MLILQRVHLYPFRTQKLSSAMPKILVWRRTGKIGQREHYSSLAQSVEHLTVNQVVAGSSPAGGAKQKRVASATRFCFSFFNGDEPLAVCSANSKSLRLQAYSSLHSLHPQTVVQSPAFASGFSVTSALPLSNQLQPILNSLFAALAASLTAYSRCRLRHEVPWTSREYALLTPQAATGLIQVVFDILPTLLVRAQLG